MASLQLENVPDDLLKRLEQAARSRDREIAAEAIRRLNDSFQRDPTAGARPHADLAELARETRGNGAGDWLTPEFIRLAREHGRE